MSKLTLKIDPAVLLLEGHIAKAKSLEYSFEAEKTSGLVGNFPTRQSQGLARAQTLIGRVSLTYLKKKSLNNSSYEMPQTQQTAGVLL